MILSYKHRFIFIKTNKTAGTSVEIALSKFCGPDDIITRLSENDEIFRLQTTGKSFQNNRSSGGFRFYSHMGLSEIRGGVGENIVGSYFKFCVVRNPWDRTVSFYFWRQSERRRQIAFADFIRSPVMDKLKERGRDLYMDEGRPRMDYFIRYEKLQDDFNAVIARFGLGPVELPKAKSGARPSRGNYRTYYSNDDADRIRELFAEEIAEFGYEF
jgi:hypothetical protein